MEFLDKAVAHVASLEARIAELEEQVLQRNLAIESLLRDTELESESKLSPASNRVLREKHLMFLDQLDKNRDSLEYVMTEHLRMQGAFWAIGASDLLGSSRKDANEICEWVFRCFDKKRGGFGGNEGHDAHVLYTQHAIYVLAQLRALDLLDRPVEEGNARTYREAVVSYIVSMQRLDGSFQGDEWGEIDTRFTYCAAVALAVLGRLEAIDCKRASEYVLSTRNELDGGFGCAKGVESHAGYVFTALGSLAVLGGLGTLRDNWDSLAWWLAERQCDSGGLNGRPEKLADVCYSWWVLSSLHVLNRLDWINQSKLIEFILACQDPETGGIADHPENVSDVYHTFFGLCGLSLLGALDPTFGEIDPVYALPKSIVKELGLKAQML
jgi:geranylgeranyl transferase type-2 subunit beta